MDQEDRQQKFHPADLPQQNNKTTNPLTQYRRGKGELNANAKKW